VSNDEASHDLSFKHSSAGDAMLGYFISSGCIVGVSYVLYID